MIYLWFVTGLIHCGLTSLTSSGRRTWWNERWLSLDLEGLFKATIIALPVLTIGGAVTGLGKAVGYNWTKPPTEPIPLFALCIGFPIVEEWGRGMIIAFWKEETGSLLTGLLISSLVFALLHSMNFDLIFVWILIFGLLNGVLINWSKSIVPAMLVHSLTNFALVVILLS